MVMKPLLSTSNIDLEMSTKLEVYEKTSSDFNLKAGPLFYAAHQLWLDTLDFIQESGKYRQAVKMYCKKVENAWRVYEEALPKLFLDNYPMYMDFCGECYTKKLENDVSNLYHAIKRVLDRNSIQESALKAYLIASRELTCHCSHFFGLYWEAASHLHGYKDLSIPFRYADLTPVANSLVLLCSNVCKDDRQEIRLTKDNDCVLALNVIDNRIYNDKWIDECGVDAMRLNMMYRPELLKVVQDYDANHNDKKEKK